MLLQIDSTKAAVEQALNFKEQAMEVAWDFGKNLIVAIVILIIGLWIAGRLTRLFTKFMEKREMDETLRPFLRAFVNVSLKILVLVIVVSTMGVQMTSIIAVLGSVGLAIGLALQGSLSNAAGGVMLLLLKPFKKGDVIMAQGVTGKVMEINIVSSRLVTFDNKVIYLPNGPLANNPITNITAESLRRVDITFGIGYEDDFEKARNIILREASKIPEILSEPVPPFVRMMELADSSVNLASRFWVKTETYWDVYFAMMENVKAAFDAEDITIPYPQRDVHIHQTGDK